MSTTTVEPPKPVTAPPLQTQTTAGNYFVSNYPPFSFWKPELIPDLQTALATPPKPNTDLGVYVHVPFCRKRCHFCYFKVYTDKDSSEIRNYIDAVIKELTIYANKPFIGGRKPSFLYFGGGTPSYLSVEQLKHLLGEMNRLLPLDALEEFSFECEPGTLTDHKLKAIRELGVTRLSLGVENFDEHILEVNGRAHRSKEIDRAYKYAREVGFPQINIDLIAGMVEETEENWKENIRKTIEMAPDSVTIYEMEIPFNTTIYQQMKAEGKLVAPVADWETKRRWVDYAFKELEKVGYTVGSAYTAVKNKKTATFIYRDRLWAGADLLSLGVASFGHIGGVHYQNHHEFSTYIERINKGELPTFRALTPTPDERLIREFILQFKLGRNEAGYYQKKFGVDVLQRFAEPIQRLKDWGFLTQQGDTLLLSREALLQVDKLLQEFFLPEHKNTRYA